jgi:hypothetical protein
MLSSNYFKSTYCRTIELPFLMWRRDHHKLMCLPLKLGTIPVDKVRLPNYQAPARTVVIGDLIDDRRAADDFARSRYRDRNLRQLREEGFEAEIEKRFDGISRHVTDFLKKVHGARGGRVTNTYGPIGAASFLRTALPASLLDCRLINQKIFAFCSGLDRGRHPPGQCSSS